MKFNNKTKGKNKTLNHEGEEAYRLSPELELYAAVLTSLMGDQFYEKTGQKIARIRKLIGENDPYFVAQLAIYAKEKMYLRSVPLVLAVELAKIHAGDQLISNLVNRVVLRADEITELLAYYQLANQRTGLKKLGGLSKQIQKGLAMAFNRFDEYQFAKYNRDAEVRLRDALFLVHPKAKDEGQQLLFDKIVNDTLQTPYTWETELSALGKQNFDSPEAKALAFKNQWESLVDSGKLGYMALLRNLRNILQARVSAAHIEKIAQRLGNPLEVQRARQFPFRYLAAYRELKELDFPEVTVLVNALEKAVKASVANIQGFDAHTKALVACDVSGSMQRAVSPKSKIQNFDIGLMLGMLLKYLCPSALTGMFGDTWKVIPVPQDNILFNVDTFYKREGEMGYSTNGYLVLKYLIGHQVRMDKIMIFTDCQLWNSHQSGESMAGLWKEYKAMAPEAKIYLFDLAGYGNSPLSVEGNGVYLIAGWSDKVFEILEALENQSDALNEIKKMVV